MTTSAVERPKILFLMSDEHRYDVAGFAGNPVVRTPVLDALAKDAVVFTNAYTPSPICVPARQCITAGQLPRTCRSENFGSDIPPNSMTFARQFSRYGYHTVCCGKLHHNGPDQMQGWSVRVNPDAHTTPQFIEGKVEEEWNRYKPKPGVGGWTVDKEITVAGIGKSVHQRYDEVTELATLNALDNYLADASYDRPGHLPLLLKYSLLLPHYPFFTDEQKFTYYLNRVPVFMHEGKPDPYDCTSPHCVPKVAHTERALRRATAAYYGMVETIDASYGRILDRMRHLGEDLDDWIILYTSDHGENLGQHGTWWKNNFYDSSAKVPLFIRYPKRFQPRTVTENVNLCDLFATLLDMAGIPLPAKEQTVHARGLDSRSLVPLMEGRSAGWNNETVSALTNNVMVKQNHLKYIWWEGREVLFDLEKDPKEQTNVAAAPAYAEVMARFRKRRAALGYGPDADPQYVNAGY
jgi:choline-sulfatase